MRERWRARLEGRRGPLLIAAIAVVLSLPALRLGFQADDRVFITRTLVEGTPATALFTADDVSDAVNLGEMAWWTSPQLSIRFMRPLASLTHNFEFRHYVGAPAVMLFANVLLYGLCVFVCAVLYRRLAGDARIGALAGWMFAIDEAHANSVGWISARNSLLSGLFALSALLLHVMSRDARPARSSEAPARRRHWLLGGSVTCVALGLASAEAGVNAAALLVAYAFVLESGGLRTRLLSIAPQLIVVSIWAGLYIGLGYGVHGSSLYREVSRPFETLGQGLLDLPLWIASLFGIGFVTPLALMPGSQGRWLTLPIALLCIGFLAPSVRRDKTCQFFALSVALGLFPLFNTLPQDRLTLGISFGAFGWLACFIVAADASARAAIRGVGRSFSGLHAYLPVVLFPLSLGLSTSAVERASQALIDAAPASRQVVLINSPIEILNLYAMSVLRLPENEKRLPDSFHALYAGASDLEVERVSATALDVHASDGWGHSVLERVFSTPEDMPRRGSVRHVREMDAEVLESRADGMPSRVRFHFSTPLDSPDRAWLIWQARTPVRWTPPAIGERIRIAGESTTESLPR